MDEDYLTDRIRASLDMARSAAGSRARLIHFEMAGRYTLLAAKLASGAAPAWPRRLSFGPSSFHRADAPAPLV